MATAAAPAADTPLLWCCYYVRATTAVLFYCCCSCYVCGMFLLLTPVSMAIMQVTPSR